MKKTFKSYIGVWAICLLTFNIIAFVVPNEMKANFWAGYIFITLAFWGQLFCANLAFKAENAEKFFYNFPLISISFVGTVIMLIVAGLTMAIAAIPVWVGIVFCLIILAFTAIAIINASVVSETVSNIDEKIKSKTLFVKMLTTDASNLMSKAQTKEEKEITKKVYEIHSFLRKAWSLSLRLNKIFRERRQFAMSDSNNITVLNPGLYKNLLAQVESIYRHSNELSFKTRARYYEATKRFCKFLADNFRLQNFKNVEDRHFKVYVEHLKENNSAATIQSDLSGIRYFHRKSGSKNRLSPNSKLNLPKRATGVKDHSLLDKELVNIRQWAIQTGRQDAVIAIDFSSEFGLRLEEICTLRVEYLMSALKTGQLVIKGKGGQTRAIDLSAKQRGIITDYLNYAKCSGRYPRDYLISGSEKGGVKREKRSLQNWMSYNRKYFMVENREDLSEDGKKKRTETISWHSLRHTYAQRTYEEALKERPKKARKIVSETLGHHRTEVTRIYLADKPKKK